jgi:hypothetical protein
MTKMQLRLSPFSLLRRSFSSLFALLVSLLFLSAPGFAQNQKGKIAGKLIDKARGEELIGATAQIEGLGMGAVTDVEGKYLISIDPGTYSVLFNYIGYAQQKISGVVVKAGEVTFLDFALEEEKSTLKEVVITATVEKSSALAAMIERKNAPQVSDGVSADLIRRTPDRSTSDVLKRVTGASIQEGKFAVIRGMNDRYNTGYLDGALLPSTEADRKAFAFDVVPANLIDNLQIIKAGSADFVGDFGGGVIRINSKAIPEKLTQSISIGGQVHSLTQFKPFTQFKRYPGEGLGLLSTRRNLPHIEEGALNTVTAFPSADEKRRFAEVSKGFNNEWDITNNTALPNARLSYSLGFPIRLSDTKKMGFIFALNHANTRRFMQSEINTFDGSGQVSAFKDRNYQQNVTTGGILNVNYVAEKTQINFRNLLNINVDNNTIRREGAANIIDNLMANNYANLVNHNRLYNSIVSLRQIVGDKKATLNASVSYAQVRRRIPDYRIVNYSLTIDDEAYRMSLGDFFNTSSGRFSSDLQERLLSGTFDISKQFNGERLRTEVKIGGFHQNRHRTFYGRSFVYGGSAPAQPTYNPGLDLGEDMIGASRLFLVEKTANDLAYYQGNSQLSAVYGMADQRIGKFRASYGLRYEYIDINVTNQKLNTDIARIKDGVVLPSANLTYSLGERSNLRAAYYASVNRPEFRELAPFSFYVFDRNAEIRGNNTLKIANLNNYEMRYEFYPTGSQVLSAGAFYKKITNPVEFSIDLAQSFTTFTFENEKSAKVYGLEFELRKNFDFLGPADLWKNIVIFSNLALVRSTLAFTEGTRATLNRPLQGQSPYVVNAGIQFDAPDASGWFASVIVNRVGRRIAFVGVDKKFGDTRQDIYENPRTVLDVQAGKNIGKLNLKLTLGDLLRQDLVFYQDVDDNKRFDKATDRTMFRFVNGFTTTLSATYTF